MAGGGGWWHPCGGGRKLKVWSSLKHSLLQYYLTPFSTLLFLVGGPLHVGDIETLGDGGACVRCPWHSWRFRLDDGHVVQPRGQQRHAHVFPVLVKPNGSIWVGFDEFAPGYFSNTDFWLAALGGKKLFLWMGGQVSSGRRKLTSVGTQKVLFPAKISYLFTSPTKTTTGWCQDTNMSRCLSSSSLCWWKTPGVTSSLHTLHTYSCSTDFWKGRNVVFCANMCHGASLLFNNRENEKHLSQYTKRNFLCATMWQDGAFQQWHQKINFPKQDFACNGSVCQLRITPLSTTPGLTVW